MLHRFFSQWNVFSSRFSTLKEEKNRNSISIYCRVDHVKLQKMSGRLAYLRVTYKSAHITHSNSHCCSLDITFNVHQLRKKCCRQSRYFYFFPASMKFCLMSRKIGYNFWTVIFRSVHSVSNSKVHRRGRARAEQVVSMSYPQLSIWPSTP